MSMQNGSWQNSKIALSEEPFCLKIDGNAPGVWVATILNIFQHSFFSFLSLDSERARDPKAFSIWSKTSRSANVCLYFRVVPSKELEVSPTLGFSRDPFCGRCSCRSVDFCADLFEIYIFAASVYSFESGNFSLALLTAETRMFSADFSVSTASKPANSFTMKPRTGSRKAQLPKPKRATSAYVYFSQHYREMLKKEGRPIPRISEFGKECASKWNVMTDKEKEPFVALANHDKQRYAQEIAAIRPQRDANKPKRPGTAFMLFMVDFRKEMAGREPAGGVAAMAKLGGERWRQMSDADKKPYVDRQNLEKTKYDLCMEQYKNKCGGSNPAEPVENNFPGGNTEMPPSFGRDVGVGAAAPPAQPLPRMPMVSPLPNMSVVNGQQPPQQQQQPPQQHAQLAQHPHHQPQQPQEEEEMEGEDWDSEEDNSESDY